MNESINKSLKQQQQQQQQTTTEWEKYLQHTDLCKVNIQNVRHLQVRKKKTIHGKKKWEKDGKSNS